ncbi:MAG: tetratricopeptide repeat protein [Kiritimatiellae bacterium]|nr:tetratricopeptide repeat protein [Kiritimatiellia bacterium]
MGTASEFALARGYADQHRYADAVRQLDALERKDMPPQDAADATLFKGICQLRLHQPDDARATFQGLPETSPGAPDAHWLLEEVSRFDELPFKKPWIAGTLSGLLPGAGQVYAGRPRDGAVAFTLNALLIWGAWESFDNNQNVTGALLCFLETGWYVGNIYNAVNSTHQYNRRLESAFFDRIQLRIAPPFRDEQTQREPCLSLHYAFSF